MRKYDLNNHLFGLNQDITWEEFRQKNIIWWNTVGKQDPKEQPTIKLDNYDFFLKWIEEEYNFSLADYEDKNVGEICCGPYGGILEASNVRASNKYFIDIFMDDFRNMSLIDWPENSVFIQAPSECIHLRDDELDFLFGYNSIDHGWDWRLSLEECLRISKRVYLMFDTKDEVDGDYHPQKISHEDVKAYVEQLNDDYNFANFGVRAQLKNYGYYENCFEWPETWVYIEK